jgi:hypothetical protein
VLIQDQAVLMKARALLVERGWCQGAMARDAAGQSVNYDDPRAASYCSVGAVYAASGWPAENLTALAMLRQPWHLKPAAMVRLALAVDGDHVARLNDNAETIDEVLAIIDKAIADCPADTNGDTNART